MTAKLTSEAAKGLRIRLQAEMERLGATEIKTPSAKARLQESTATVQVDDPTAVPARFRRVKEEIDKAGLAEALKRGERDAEMCARLHRGKHVQFY